MRCTSPPLFFLRSLAALLLASAAHAASAGALVDAGRPTRAAQQAVAVLADASAEGLLAQDYDAPRLAQAVAAAIQGPALAPDAAARLEEALTAALHRYLADLHSGRVDPRTIHADFTVDVPERLDPASYLSAALASPNPADVLRAGAPQIPLYASLRTELAHYRKLADHPAWSAPLPALPKRKLEPEQAWDGLPLLTQRLVALGDLPEGTQPPAVYDNLLQDGVKAFQQRHALAADAALGKGTLEQLAVTPAERVRQIELAMERLRWTPQLQAPRSIVVNVPEFVLRAYEWRDGKVSVALSMNVIVGKALRTRTPLFDENMRFIEFSPYWNVPPSIARSETIPRLRRDPAYFDKQEFEFVGSNGQVHTGLSAANLDAVAHGQMRIRQRPGPHNALGDIKFVFPNKNNIYMHHTPSVQLFTRERRDFSHGCIRVEDPVGLAQFVLQSDPLWTKERIQETMGRGKSSTLRLANPLPVVIAYSTTMVKNGKVHFFADIYQHDRLLEQALQQQAQAREAARRAPLAPAAGATMN